MTPNIKASKQTAVIILGMHRSGTSALTRVCNILGVELGDTLLPPVKGNNETGFWEHFDTVATNEELLNAIGMNWDDPRALPERWTETAAANASREKILTFLKRDFSTAPLWGIKDPRMCRLMPLWDPIIAQTGAESAYIMVLRHPLEVARSLYQRDCLSTGRGLVLWLRHVLEAERATRGKRRTFVSYDLLMRDWQPAIEGLVKQLGLSFHEINDMSRAEIENFISPSLRHFSFHDTELYDSATLARWTGRVFAACRALERNPQDPKSLADMDMVARELDQAGSYFDDIIGESAPRERKLREEIADLHRKVSERENWANEQISRVSERDARIMQRDARIASLSREISDMAEKNRQAISEIMIENSRLNGEIQFIGRTWSWRLTRPFRGMTYRALRNLGGWRMTTHHMTVASAVDAEPLGNNTFRALKPNPQLMLSSPQRFFPQGRVEISYHIEASQSATPCIIVDTGQGFGDANRFRLPETCDGAGRTIIRLPNRVVGLRFDLENFGDTFEIKSINIREVSRIGLRLAEGAHRLRRFADNCSPAKRLRERLREMTRKRTP